ncbi:MAG: squalene/phytoene synthase family protein [Hyphomicrobiaceae bacterium]|nr:squalene/phytoene synthase family protein [Hyphomicrobiaceae bacterium]
MDGTAFEEVRAAARAHAHDRYLAALLAPRSARRDLIAIAALAGELERIPTLVSEPMLGEIRLQWWWDWAATEASGPPPPTGNPVADAMLSLFAEHASARGLVRRLIEARMRDLEPGEDLIAQSKTRALPCHEAEAVAFRLSALVLDPTRGTVSLPEATSSNGAIALAATAYGGVRLALRLPAFQARGRLPPYFCPPGPPIDADTMHAPAVQAALDGWRSGLLARSANARVELSATWRSLPRHIKIALLPVALVEPYLRVLQVRDEEWRSLAADIDPLTRVCRLAIARYGGWP